MSIKVTLRKKAISGNRQSLYLDFYPAIPHAVTGEPTRREFLGLYLIDKPQNPIDKQHNKEITDQANQIRAKREVFINKPEIYSGYEKAQLKINQKLDENFVEYFKALADKRKASNHDNWISAYKYLDTFTKGKLKFADLDLRFCEDFKEYLQTTKSNKSDKTQLSHNSAVSYFNKLKAALKQAYKDGYLQSDINASVESLKQAESRRSFLTLEELNSLAKTPCNNPLLKRAALFSALTGLRFSDISKLTWREIEEIEGAGCFIHFTQQKTNGIESQPISEQALSLIGERKRPTDKVFAGLNYSAYENRHLWQWIGAAGITKHITFHCFRHTYATLLLSHGTDIYTVSKMLGHREIRTTQVYAKVMDKAKREAANSFKIEF